MESSQYTNWRIQFNNGLTPIYTDNELHHVIIEFETFQDTVLDVAYYTKCSYFLRLFSLLGFNDLLRSVWFYNFCVIILGHIRQKSVFWNSDCFNRDYAG